MTVQEYLQLKRKKNNLLASKGLKNLSDEKKRSIETNLQNVTKAIEVAEKSDEIIIGYKQILNHKII